MTNHRTTTPVTFRLDAALVRELRVEAETSGRSQTRIVADALADRLIAGDPDDTCAGCSTDLPRPSGVFLSPTVATRLCFPCAQDFARRVATAPVVAR